MKWIDIVARGDRNVADAAFVRTRLIPVAYNAERWSIVVHEAFRVAELLVKGMFCLSGKAHKHHHRLSELIDDFVEHIEAQGPPGPFLYALEQPNGDAIGVSVTAKWGVNILKRVSDTYTMLGSMGREQFTADELLRLRLDVIGSSVTLRAGDRKLIGTTDLIAFGAQRISRSFSKPPTETALRTLKDATEKLLRGREAAYFAEHEHTRDDADEAVRLMNTVLDASSAFVQRD